MNNMVLNLLSNLSPQNSSLGQIASILKAARNPMAALSNMAQNDPRLQEAANLINMNGGNVQQAVYVLAQQKGININDLLNQAKSLMR